MAIDTSIYNRLQPVQIENPLESFAKVAQVQNAQQQNKLAELTLGEKQRQISGDNALASLLASGKSGADVATGLAQQGYGAQSIAYTKQAAEMAKQQREAEKEKLVSAKTQIELIGQVAGAAKDPQSYAAGLHMLAQAGVDISQIPQQYDPAYVANARNQALTAAQQIDQVWKAKNYDLDTAKFGYQQQNDAANRSVTLRGQNMTDARGREANALKAQENAQGGKAPAGYRWKQDGTLEAIPGGPGEKLPESQQKQVVGVNNLSAAISEYRNELASFGGMSKLSPDARAKMGTKYNNMMLQAKEAYNLGVLNGPDLEILTNVITDPRSAKAILLSKDALDTQASELDRMMQGVGKVSGQAKQPQNKPGSAAPASTGGWSIKEKK